MSNSTATSTKSILATVSSPITLVGGSIVLCIIGFITNSSELLGIASSLNYTGCDTANNTYSPVSDDIFFGAFRLPFVQGIAHNNMQQQHPQIDGPPKTIGSVEHNKNLEAHTLAEIKQAAINKKPVSIRIIETRQNSEGKNIDDKSRDLS